MEVTTEKPQECEVKVQFPNLTEEQLEHLFKAEEELLKADIHFDTGYLTQQNIREWELDWSLKGAKVIFKRMKYPSNVR